MAKIKNRESQMQVLERYRGEKSKTEFCADLGISRPTLDAWMRNAEISLKFLSFLAVDYVEDWRGAMAVELIERIDPRFVPCPCETEPNDHGTCPRRHGVSIRREDQERGYSTPVAAISEVV